MKRRQVPASPLDWSTMLDLTERLKRDGLHRDYLLIFMGCHFGLRIGDLLSLRWRDIVGKNEIIIIERKTKKRRCITINNNVHMACNHVLEHLILTSRFSMDHFIFANRYGSAISTSYVNKRLKTVFAAYEVKTQNPVTSHFLRKSFGRKVYLNGGENKEESLIFLSSIFSHSSTAITRAYIGLTSETIASVYINL